MRMLEPLWVSISTYSVLPTPSVDWTETNTRFSICFLPLVGVIPGGAVYLWAWLAGTLGVDSILFAALGAALPLLLTGGIHMDGFMDTVDALASHQPREEMLAILKDPRAGAFAILYCGLYLLLSLGLYHALFGSEMLTVVCLGFVLSRALTALSAITLPSARRGGMLHMLAGQARTRTAVAAMGLLALLAAGGMIWISPAGGGGAIGLGLLVFLFYRRMVIKQFGGATGDTSGFFLQSCELALLCGAWLGGLL